jgi:hypothetical protein
MVPRLFLMKTKKTER